jgi:hypothetical protein
VVLRFGMWKYASRTGGLQLESEEKSKTRDKGITDFH